MNLPIEPILNSLEEAILCLDRHSKILFLNAAGANLFQCDPRSAVGQPADCFPTLANAIEQLDLTPSSDAQRAPQALRAFTLRRPNSDPAPMQATLSRIRFDGADAWLAVFRSSALQQQLEKTVYDARKTQAIGSLAGGIAHDFNNILTAVISQIDLTLTASEFPATLKQHLIYAQTSARRGAELVSKLQAFSRKSNADLTPTTLTEVIEQVAFLLRRGLDRKITVECPEPTVTPWLADTDPTQLMQAVLNLGINARDAMPTGGRLTLTLENVTIKATDAVSPRKEGQFVNITVADTGKGMPPEVLEHIFDPYFTTKDPSRGPGLGLSITAAVVAEHAGWMEVESIPDSGTRFSIFLPRTTRSETAPTQPIPKEPAEGGGNERILIVDDEELVRMVTKAVLAYRGYKVAEAEDGEDAVAQYAADPSKFHLILMDMHMPRLNGYDALLRIREINPKAKAILLSGGVHLPGDSIRSIEKVAFLHKPFENQELIDLVRKQLDTQ